MSAGDTKASAGRGTPAHKQPIDEVTAADSVVALLSELNTDKFPREERLAVNRLQSKAIALRLNWISELCRTISNRSLESRNPDRAGDSTAGGDRSHVNVAESPGHWWKWAHATIAAGKARLGLS